MTIRVGILGFGYMGGCHVPKIEATPGIEVVAVHDIAPEKREIAQKAGYRFYESRAGFLSSDIDMVLIATPNQFHKPYAIEALKAGKHVLCEKPVTLNVAEFDEIAAVAKEAGKIFTVHQNRRWDTDFRVVRKAIEEGMVGKPVAIESRVLGERGIVFGWRADPESGGGMVYDWGVHQIDQLLYAFEDLKVTCVYAQLHRVNTPSVDDYFKVELTFENGMTAHVECGVFALEKLPRWYVYGDAGTLRVDDFSGTAGRVSNIHKDAMVEVAEGVDGVIGTSRTMAPLRPEQVERHALPQVEDASREFYIQLVQAINTGSEPPVTIESARRTMCVVDAVFRSSAEGASVRVEI